MACGYHALAGGKDGPTATPEGVGVKELIGHMGHIPFFVQA